MKNTMKLLGIIALVAVIGFGMAACNNGTTGGIDSAIVARWYESQGMADAEILNLYPFELKADGTYTYSSGPGQSVQPTQTYSASRGKLTFSNGDTADYAISGTKLTLSNASGSILKNGDYYKKAQ